MDMLIIDGDGKAHIFDMNAKSRPDFSSYDRRDYTFQLNTYQSILEGIILGIKVASKQLIWFTHNAVQGADGVTYTTDEKTGIVTVSKDNTTQPLSDYVDWNTPALVGDYIKPIEDKKSSTLGKIEPIDPEWSTTQNFNKNVQTQMELSENLNEKPDFSKVGNKKAGETVVTIKGEEAPIIPNTEMRVDKDNPRAKYLQALSSNQRTYRGEWVGHEFSKVVSSLLEDEIQETLDLIDELQGGDEETADRSQMLSDAMSKLNTLNDPDKGRKYIIETKTPSFIFDEVKKRIERQKNRIETKGNLTEQQKYIANQLKLTLDYWDFIVNESLGTIESAESVRIVTFNTTKMDNDATTGGDVKETADDSDNNEDETNDDETGSRNANGNEGWGFKMRITDPITTLSKAVKAILGSLLMRGENGKTSIDDLGNNRYLNQEYAHAVLISELSAYKSPDEFCKEVKEEDYDAVFGEDFEDAYDFSCDFYKFKANLF